MVDIKLNINTDLLERRKSEINATIIKLQEELLFLNTLTIIKHDQKSI